MRAQVFGVLAADLSLASIREIVNSVKPSGAGTAFLFTKTDELVLASDQPPQPTPL